MDREKLLAALRVLCSQCAGKTPLPADLDLLRKSALAEERDLEIDDLARVVARRELANARS